MLKIGQLAQIKSESPYVYEALTQIVNGVNAVGLATGVDPSGTIDPPATIGSLSVLAADGIFDLAITDNSAVRRGIFYFAEPDATACRPASRVFSGQLAQPAHHAGKPDALLARLLAISWLGPLCPGHVWHAGNGSHRWRDSGRPGATGFDRKWHSVRQRRRLGLR